MSKFSSFKEDQLLFENWRGHVNDTPSVSVEEEITSTPVQELGIAEELAGMSEEEIKEWLAQQQRIASFALQAIQAGGPQGIQ